MENEKKVNEVFYVGDKKFTNEDEATRYEKRHNEGQKQWDRADFFADLTGNILSICVVGEVGNQVVVFLDSKYSQKMNIWRLQDKLNT